jgi:hypothetical protein
MSSLVPGYGNSILPFHTTTGTFGTPVWAGSEPSVGRVSDDGRYLYVLLYGANSVKRFRLPELVADLEFPVRSDGGVRLSASALFNVPGEPSTTIAVERSQSLGYSTYGYGVAIYDDGVPRSASGGSDANQFSDDGAWLFSIVNSLSSFPAGRSPVTRDGIGSGEYRDGVSAGFFAQLRCLDSRCITSSGILFDPFTLTRVRMFGDGTGDSTYGPFDSGTRLEIDPATDRVFFLSSSRIDVYTISTGALAKSIGNVSGSSINLLPSGELIVLGNEEFDLIPVPDR